MATSNNSTPAPKPKPTRKPAAKPEMAAPTPAPVEVVGPSRQPSRATLTKIIVAVVAVVVLVVAAFAVAIYSFASTNSLTNFASSIIPYPAERVNNHLVGYHDYLFELNANEKAYQSNAKLNNQPTVDWKSANGKKLLSQIKQHALAKLEDDVITAQLAHKYKVSVSDKDVNDLVNSLYDKYGGKDTLLKTLSQIYGWNIDDLKHVVRKQLLAQKVQTAVAKDPAIDAQTKAKATDVLGKLKGGADFAATAKQYSQASDAANGGDMGSFTKGQVDDATYTAATALQPGSLSDVIKTKYGYQIIKVIDKTGDSVHAQEILIKNVDFNSYFATQQKAAKVKTFIKTS